MERGSGFLSGNGCLLLFVLALLALAYVIYSQDGLTLFQAEDTTQQTLDRARQMSQYR